MSCAGCDSEHRPDEPCATIVRSPLPGADRPARFAKAPDDPLVGSRLGSFRLMKRLGAGGMGSVYLAEHELIGSRVAAKLLHAHVAADPKLVDRFYAEGRAANLVRHPNIVNIFDLCITPAGQPYLLMELLEGQSLAQTAVPMAPADVVSVLVQILDALDAAHSQGVIHRDLKPENVLLIARDGRPFVKLLDFGIAKILTPDPNTRSTCAGAVIGTPEYMAPEQAAGQPIDARADIYATGVMAYQLLTGKLPHSGRNLIEVLVSQRDARPPPPSALSPQVPADLSAIVMRALATEREARFPNAREMYAAIKALRLDAATQQRPPASRVEAPPQPPAPGRPIPLENEVFFPATIRLNGQLQRVRCTELSRGGMFICSDNLSAPIRSQLAVSLEAQGRTLECLCEVVRVVTLEQAAQWRMRPGLAVEWVGASPQLREDLERLRQGKSLSTPPAPRPAETIDDPITEEVLRSFRRRLNGDHYGVLGVPPDADFERIRLAGSKARRELEAVQRRPMTAAQRTRWQAALDHVAQAVHLLGSPVRRLNVDAPIGNFRGVARSIAAGVSTDELDQARRRHLSQQPKAETQARIHLASASSHERAGRLALAIDEYAHALEKDPLALEVQRHYWGLKRRAMQENSGSPTARSA